MGGAGGWKAASLPVSGGEVESTGPAATGFVGLVVEVKEFESAHHHTRFCMLDKSCPISAEYFRKCKALWDWSWMRGKGNNGQKSGSESSKVVQQNSLHV